MEDTQTNMFIDIVSNGISYFTKLKLLDGTLIDAKFQNNNISSKPTIRDLVREHIKFSSEATLEQLALQIQEITKEKALDFNDPVSAEEVANNCLEFLLDFPMETLDDYVRESRIDVVNLVYANSICGSKILGEADRKAIADIIKLNPARFKFNDSIQECINILGPKINIALSNKY
ncbi:hypothetical protein [Psychromonas sp. SP041]|uniref:hypothetical protein n=1 Tax=Psychromonas sp. SP041 TaxID=1365007 RepID=UPI0010C7B353|nr:hypothetical protein [Psychromonas sp. SP041]